MILGGLLVVSVFWCSSGAPTQEERSDTVALAASSSPAMNTWTLRPLRFSVGSSSAKIVLNAFTTFAPGTTFWIYSAAEVECPIVSPLKSVVTGFEMSMTILFARSPAAFNASTASP